MTALLTHHDTVFVNGRWAATDSAERIEVVSPWTEQIIGSVPSATRADVDRAVEAARRAFDHGPWRTTSPAERTAVLGRLRDQMASERTVLAKLATDEMGCPISQSVAIQVGGALTLIDAYIAVNEAFPFRQSRFTNSGNALVTREPVGVVAAVVPWNVPYLTCLQKLLPALLAGCTVVLKPAPQTPLTAYALTSLLAECGLPDGVVNVLPADRDASEYLVGHPGIDKVTFTGSTAAGRRIAEICGRNLTRVTLELGGKSAAVVLDDADLDAAVESMRLGSLRNSGQICSLKTRILVSRGRQGELVERLDAMVASMPVGDPHDPATQIGPMVTAAQRDNVNRYIRIGADEGARVARGGSDPGQPHGWFVEPTVFCDVTPSMTIAQEEVFGPVLAVMPFDDEDDAIAKANNSVYGLNGSVFSQDVQHALAVASRLRTGTVEINGASAGFQAPMGGVKNSGIGREGGPEGLESYLEPKSYGLSASDLAALGDTR